MAPEDAALTFHPEILPPNQQRVLAELGPTASERGFYLGGGTALALQVGHRRSVDLDWFTGGTIPDPLAFAQELRSRGILLETPSVDAGTLHGLVDGVRVSFFEYPYPKLRPEVVWEEFSSPLAALEDLACMKLSAIAGRGARKDFIDIYALCRAGLSLRAMLDLYSEKFETSDLGHVLFSLTYFDDAEAESMPEMLWNVEWGVIRQAIEQWVREFARR
jgi:hypothetical protein